MSSTYKLSLGELEQIVEDHIYDTDNWRSRDLRIFVEKLCKKHKVSKMISEHLMEEAFDLFYKLY